MVRSRIRLAMVATLAIAISGCSRGPAPPAPTEDLTPTEHRSGRGAGWHTAGIARRRQHVPAVVQRVSRSHPELAEPRCALVRVPEDLVRLDPGVLLLAGQRADGSWWYELAGEGGSVDEGCWTGGGGSFDEGDSVRDRQAGGCRRLRVSGSRLTVTTATTSNGFPGMETTASAWTSKVVPCFSTHSSARRSRSRYGGSGLAHRPLGAGRSRPNGPRHTTNR